MPITRRRFVAATAFIAAGSASGQMAFAQNAGTIKVEIAEPEALRGLSGEALREALLKQVSFVSSIDGALKVQFLAGRLVNGRMRETFASTPFEENTHGRTQWQTRTLRQRSCQWHNAEPFSCQDHGRERPHRR